MKKYSYFPGMQALINSCTDSSENSDIALNQIFATSLNMIELSAQVFIVTTLRSYEEQIITEQQEYIKKIKPITALLRDKFMAPSLGVQLDLCKFCFHLIDRNAPEELLVMKSKLDEIITLGSIGLYLDELSRLYDSIDDNSNKVTIENRDRTKKRVLALLNDFVPFRNDSAHLVNISKLIDENKERLNQNRQKWIDGFLALMDILEPFLNVCFATKKVNKIFTENSVRMVSIDNWEFSNGNITTHQQKLSLEDWYEDQWDDQTIIIVHDKDGNKKDIEAFPFLLLKEHKLFYYKKTRTSGYDYFCPEDSKVTKIKSKNKFNKTLFKTSSIGNTQAIFWSEVLPEINSINGIKANIPSQGNSEFIGRKKKIEKIRNEIIEIPNQNGIIYGPGGVGKTALLIELTQQLFLEKSRKDILYENIIWISAKSNFYYWEQNTTINKPQQFETLENILQIILRFFDYQDVEEYSKPELLVLVFELLEENKILLILDNFETIAKNEISKIISFFETDVKRHLRFKPTQFKVILTSRELIPSGYFQMKLEGLDSKESIELMESIYKRYKDSHPHLSLEQYNLIHNAAQGIPIVIKHCLGQIFEFNIPLSEITTGLNNEQNEVIKFSYSEILLHLKKDAIFLQILLLLEIKNEPTSIRQISLALEIEAAQISICIPTLLNFQCIDKINSGIEEKYKISNQIGLLGKKLIGENPDLTNKLRTNITENLTWEKRIDSETEEWEIIEIFNSRIESRDFEFAIHFLDQEINKRPSSLLLNLNKALFLRDRKKDYSQAIQILEKLYLEIKASDKTDPSILLALVSCYTMKDFPDFEKAGFYCEDLELHPLDDVIKMVIGDFYVSWSTHIKQKKELDPFKEMERRTKVKDLAKKGINILTKLSSEFGNHKYHQIMAQAYFNQWDTDNAKKFINRAIDLSYTDIVSKKKYESFLSMVNRYFDKK